MNLRNAEQPDSLEMLLDTMCNTFGGIILIALLVSYLAQNSTLFDSEAARQARETLQTLRTQLNQPAYTGLVLLLQTNKALQQTYLQLEEQHRQFSANLQHLAELSNRIAQAQNTRPVRFPVVRSTTKRPWNLILRYGRVYPLHFFQNGSSRRNTSSLAWQPDPLGDRLQPIADQGVDAQREPAEFSRLFNELPTNRFYLDFQVFADSFGAFSHVRTQAVALGFQMGWNAYEANQYFIWNDAATGEGTIND